MIALVNLTAPVSADDVYRGLAIAIAFMVLLATAEILHNRYGWGVEWTRKLVHLGGGIICLMFPFLIQSHWVVLALAVSMAGIFLVSRRLGYLQSVHAVKRKSRGSEYYPVVIYLLFLLAADKPWMFVICVLVLSVADSAAAIVGSKYGRLTYCVENETKSVEGSLAFFVATLVLVLLPLLFFKPEFDQLYYPYWHYVLAACLIGLLVTCFEAVSGQGRDNLFIPLGTYLVLAKTFQTDFADLLTQIVSFVLILSVLLLLSGRSRSFQAGGAIVICLASYGCWAMGSFDWALPVFIGYGLYVVAALSVELPWRLSIRPVVLNVLPPFLILAIGNLALNSGRPDLTSFCFGPFLAACCVALSQAVFNAVNWKHRRDMTRRAKAGMLASVVCLVLLVIPSMVRLGMYDWRTILLLVVNVFLFSLASARILPPMPPAEAPPRWLGLRAGFTVGSAVTIALLQWVGLSQIWNVPV